MNLIRGAITRPIAVISIVLMTVMFGVLALSTIPVQLAPDVQNPVINIQTIWPGAAPAEIEREIINQQEEVLAGVEGLAEMTSASRDSVGEITLEFNVGTDMDKALLLVASRLDRVPSYPAEALKPTLQTAGAQDNPITWMSLLRTGDNSRPMHTYGDFANDVVKERIERVPGVGFVNVYGGTERELQVIIDAQRMASYGITIGQMLSTLRAANVSLSAGDIEEGKRRYVVRSEGELNDPQAIADVLLRSARDPLTGAIARVTVGDVATLAFDYTEPGAHIRDFGESTIAVNAVRETGANVIQVMAGIRTAVEELNAGPLAREQLKLKINYDETVYITSAIELVQTNIWVGGTLAALMLMLFLRSLGATAIVSVAIPVSVVGSFVAMAALGRSIIVVSLAGLAFAVGMVVDAAIVVLENIYRLRQSGLPVREAAYRGASEVWGAVLVSALTTVMVFIPILVMELEVGQLFRDIAVAISVAVMLSLLVAVTVIPALSVKLLGGRVRSTASRPLPVVDAFARRFSGGILAYTRWAIATRARALAVAALICGVSGLLTTLLMPKLEYLPEGNRNFVFGFIIPPPGYNLETVNAIASSIEDDLRPLWAPVTGPEPTEQGIPKLESFFFVTLRNRAFLGGQATEETEAYKLIDPLRGPAFKEPGTFGFVLQPSIFGRGVGGARSVDLDITGPDLETILGIALQAVGRLNEALPFAQGNQMTPQPGLELGAPEVRVRPDRTRLADARVSAQELSLTVDAYNDGIRVAEVTVGNDRLNLMLMGPEGGIEQTQGIASLPVITADGTITTVGELARVELTQGPTEIRHRARARTVTLQVRPAAQYPLEQAMDILRDEVIAPMAEAGLPPGVNLTLSGTADKLDVTWNAMQLQLLVALVIVYLVMAILFESFFYPLIIVLSVPLATAGAFLLLWLVNVAMMGSGPYAELGLWARMTEAATNAPALKFDMLTLLGFVILIGIVVNNAILLVHQTLHHLRDEAMAVRDAILTATSNRIRPIFMSSLTSIFGMLPLVLFPGAGSELYRGLGVVVLGGLSLSSVLTLTIIPPLLSLAITAKESVMPAAAESASA